MKAKNLTGQIFGRLTVEAQHHERANDGHARWICKCKCGTTKIVTQNHLIKGSTKSCGCLLEENRSTYARKHGMRNEKIYSVWQSMFARCQRPSHASYKRYGAKGITVCQRWRLFENFYEDMGAGYKHGLDIDRINTLGNYEPSNCRWVTRTENCRNRTSTKLFEEDVGVIKSILTMGTISYKVLADEFKVSKSSICEISKNKRGVDVAPYIAY